MLTDFARKILKNHTQAFRFARRLRWVLHAYGEGCPVVYNCRGWTSNKYIRNFLKVIVSPLYLFKYFIYRDIPGREGLAFVLIAKNEAPYIEEWIHFHHKQGVSHFIIYDNDSTDNFHEVLKPYIDSGLVTYKLLSGKARQLDAYNMALHDYGRKFKYMAMIDADEFMFVRRNTYTGVGHYLYAFVDGFMKAHPNAGGLAVNWCMFGSNGHISKPEGEVLENYTRSAKNDMNLRDNHVIKTVFDPAKAVSFISDHFPIYRIGFNNLDETGRITYGTHTQEVHYDMIRINHYFTKSREEFIAKRSRGRADGAGMLSMEEFDSHDHNEAEDTEILLFAAKLNKEE